MRQAASGDVKAGSDDRKDNFTACLFVVIKLWGSENIRLSTGNERIQTPSAKHGGGFGSVHVCQCVFVPPRELRDVWKSVCYCRRLMLAACVEVKDLNSELVVSQDVQHISHPCVLSSGRTSEVYASCQAERADNAAAIMPAAIFGLQNFWTEREGKNGLTPQFLVDVLAVFQIDAVRLLCGAPISPGVDSVVQCCALLFLHSQEMSTANTRCSLSRI